MNLVVAYIATNASPFVANRETDVALSERYASSMLNHWLTEALSTSCISQAELARKLTAALGRSIDRAAVNKMVKGNRKIAADEMIEIARATDFPAPEDVLDSIGTVPLKGYVGAGALYVPFEQSEEIGRVPAPENSNEFTVAVEIRGDSLGSIFDRWLVFYDDMRAKPETAQINRLCVVGLDDGRIMVKKIKRGQVAGRFTLLSNTEEPIYDVVIEWCAVVKNMAPQ